jgi:hypothetical protein
VVVTEPAWNAGDVSASRFDSSSFHRRECTRDYIRTRLSRFESEPSTTVVQRQDAGQQRSRKLSSRHFISRSEGAAAAGFEHRSALVNQGSVADDSLRESPAQDEFDASRRASASPSQSVLIALRADFASSLLEGAVAVVATPASNTGAPS